MDELYNTAIEFFDKYENDPIGFARDILGSNPWEKQQEIMQSVVDNNQTIVQSAYDIGKSFTAAQVMLWFLYTRIPSKIICTSSSWSQVEKILFAEIAAAYGKSKVPLGGQLLTAELKIHKDWYILGLSPKIDANAEAYRIEGFHSPNVLILLDQAHGINPKIWDICVGLNTTETSRTLVLGNPASASGRYYDACKSHKWNKIKVTAFDSPNVKEGRDVIPGIVNRQWIEDRKDDWGEQNPLYVTKVLAEFPLDSDDVLVPLTLVDKALANECVADGAKGIGIDVARFGSAKTVITCIVGDKVVEILSYQGKDTMKTAGQAIRMMGKYKVPANAVCVDDSGVGGGVTDRLHEEGHRVQGINNGSAANDKVHYANLSAELHWKLRDRFQTERIQIPNEPMLISQLPGRKYTVDSKGRIKIESKDDMVKRGLKSPDFPDSLVLALHGQQLGIEGGVGAGITVLGVDDDDLVF